LREGAVGTVSVRYRVETNGRPTGCTVTRSSGNRDLDETTCRLIERRFRYRPARDFRGRPVAETVSGRHRWWTRPREPYYYDP
jgi:protein TonB